MRLRTSPFKNKRSKAKRHTRTWISSTLTSLRFLLLNSWNGMSLPVVRSMATASASNTNDFVESLIHYRETRQLQSANRISPEKTNLGKLFDEVWVFFTHVLRISTKDSNCAILQLMYLCPPVRGFFFYKHTWITNLCPFPIIFIFASKAFAFESVKYFSDSLRRLSEHRLQWYARGKFAVFPKFDDTKLKQGWNDLVIGWQFTIYQ
jgi:hypothetical protein